MPAKNNTSVPGVLQVAVAAPAHSDLPALLSYSSEQPLAAGSLVRVPLGSREVLGIVWDAPDLSSLAAAPPATATLKPIEAALPELGHLSSAWRQLLAFSARYYQRSLGEVALAALPPQLRELDALQLARRLKKPARAFTPAADSLAASPSLTSSPTLTDEQTQALADFFAPSQQPGLLQRPALLMGSTGSGKTEVYLHSVARVLQGSPTAQALVMVPEINLTPQLEARFRARFTQECIVTMHSGMTPAQRLSSWLLAHSAQARIILGTRMSIFASAPHLALIIVDEEHDASYKSQDGARHSARDLAVMRAKLETENGHSCQVLLGSATPSLESWQACEQGRYLRLQMHQRIGQARLPQLRLADMRVLPRGTLFAPPLLAALQEVVARGEQALLFLNRRGYAPVLACDACGWKSECPHCSAYRVFHKSDRSLRCHHCGHTERVPRACPECGNIDIAPLGRGTQKLEEQIALALIDVKQADGNALRILRIDADTTKLKGALQAQLAQVHAGEVDILVGTQMVTKGHDFRRISLVAALDADAALFSSDFRAPERLFALLMQAAGRAGRDASASAAQMWVQTRNPGHPLFAALAQHDYEGYARAQLQERAQAQLPPFSYQALLRAEARSQEVAQAFLQDAFAAAQAMTNTMTGDKANTGITVYPPVPMSLQRVADVERAQMLVEGSARGALQAFLAAWLPQLRSFKRKGLIRFAVDVDPLQI
jgi:primosomal protein N' (replication factor Y) (superfamily II helicase)